MNTSSQNEYYRGNSRIQREKPIQKVLETHLSYTKSPSKEKRKFNDEYEGTANSSYQIQPNLFVNRPRIAPSPMFKTTVQKHGVIKYVLKSTERIHSESQKHSQTLNKQRSERDIFCNKMISVSTKRSYKKIKQEYFISNEESDIFPRAEITYLQNSEVDVKPLISEALHQINHFENKLIGKNKYQIISYAKKEEKLNTLNQTQNEIFDDDMSETNVLVFKSKKKF
ncbi:unnamed protein product (macronuclear) [Paramecium tetraurelia]|uniref:Uncharacterized protein n=1 Tax=Paramecium tetraurelia TaxID=5888 RepID=A0CMM6_PARTE|nr:uncharacterized protein GSPATT00008522001 [Paramecium tetraurelia]CAK72043.1 unnamed protein product [Paramecium tetraurelia]|eukprot:XP_001439440.1 hypothetical protein (macronuclear) [Paramecium tetraurelia strain d4-2]